jgi:hypothetical protein
MQINLDIYVESDCSNCQMAYDIADLVRDEVPAVQVAVVDISEPEVPRPDKVFAVPTYLLNGQTRSLGNPDAEELVAELKELVKQ